MIKSRFHSLDAVILCVLAVLIVNIGMLISKVLSVDFKNIMQVF